VSLTDVMVDVVSFQPTATMLVSPACWVAA